jgi:hypothetical protein
MEEGNEEGENGDWAAEADKETAVAGRRRKTNGCVML